MIDGLEPRRLFAASAVLDGNVLKIVGTNDSNRIEIIATVITTQDGAARPNVVVSPEAYSISIDGQSLGRFRAADVGRINVFALGGNDRVITPNVRGGNVFERQGDITDLYTGLTTTATPASVTGPIFASLYIEGGSGRDGLYGSSGNDTIKGGRGDDVLFGGLGHDQVDGGAGDDYVYVNDGVPSGLLGPGKPAPRGTGDTIISQAGRDEIYHDERDRLTYTAPRWANPMLDNSSGVVIEPQAPFVID